MKNTTYFFRRARAWVAVLLPLFALAAFGGPKTAQACVYCLEHMGMDPAMYWTSDVMVTFQMWQSNTWVAGSKVLPGLDHSLGSQTYLEQENTLQVLMTPKWMLQVSIPVQYDWKWGAANTVNPGTTSYLAEPGDIYIGSLWDVYDRNTFSGATRIVLLASIHFPTAPSTGVIQNQVEAASVTANGQYEIIGGIEGMHIFSNGRWMVAADSISSFETPQSSGYQPGFSENMDVQVQYKLFPLHSELPETWLTLGDYAEYDGTALYVSPYTNGTVTGGVYTPTTTPAGNVYGSELFFDSVGVGFQIMPRSVPNLMFFGKADYFVYTNNPGSSQATPGGPFDTYSVLTGIMWMF